MTLEEIAKYRLINQQLAGTKCTRPKEMVGYLGAVQAQDYAMAKWAVGIRLSTTENAIEKALDDGDIVRTHILRPTWHMVAASDIRWMLALTAPQIKKTNNAMSRKYGLDTSILNRCNAIIEKSLSGRQYLTRKEIVLELNHQGIDTSDLRANLIIVNAELDGIVCNGSRRGKQFTYALLDERVPPANPFAKEEGLAALAQRYFTSHGPATLHDFAWWSGLTLTDARQALELVRPYLLAAENNGQTYWFDPALSADHDKGESVLFLPAFDEYMVSYKDRSASLDPSVAKAAITGNGIFRPIIVIGGKVVGLWKRTFQKSKVLIEPYYFYPPPASQKQAVREAAACYGNFMEMETVMQ